jgi:hypothetical protein
MSQKNNFFSTAFPKISGIVFFLILVFALNQSLSFIDMDIYQKIVEFLNDNLLLVVMIVVFLIISEIFDRQKFPVNIPSPIIKALTIIMAINLLEKSTVIIEFFLNKEIILPRLGILLVYFASVSFVLTHGYLGIYDKIKQAEEVH